MAPASHLGGGGREQRTLALLMEAEGNEEAVKGSDLNELQDICSSEF